MFKTPSGRGPDPEPLQPGEVETLVGYLDKGHGKSLACRMAGIGYRRFKRHYDDDSEFREAVQHAQRCARQVLEAKGYALAVTGDADALFKMLARMDRGRQLALGRAAAAAERRAQQGGGKTAGWDSHELMKIGLRDLRAEDLEAMRRIFRKMEGGKPLDAEEERTLEHLAGEVLTNLFTAAQRLDPPKF